MPLWGGCVVELTSVLGEVSFENAFPSKTDCALGRGELGFRCFPSFAMVFGLNGGLAGLVPEPV